MNYPWTQANQTLEIDALANDAGIAAEEAKAEQAAEQPIETCLWIEVDYERWDTTCGESFSFDDDGPEENGFIYCCYCGKKLRVEALRFWFRGR